MCYEEVGLILFLTEIEIFPLRLFDYLVDRHEIYVQDLRIQ